MTPSDIELLALLVPGLGLLVGYFVQCVRMDKRNEWKGAPWA